MSSFATDFADAAGPMIIDVHGEEITYTPREGTARQIKAVVEREAPGLLEEAPGQMAPMGVILVMANTAAISKDTRGGIGGDELNLGGDTVTLSIRIGADAQEVHLHKLLDQSGGTLRISYR